MPTWVETRHPDFDWSLLAAAMMAVTGWGIFELGSTPKRKRHTRPVVFMFAIYFVMFFLSWVGLTHVDLFRGWWQGVASGC